MIKFFYSIYYGSYYGEALYTVRTTKDKQFLIDMLEKLIPIDEANGKPLPYFKSQVEKRLKQLNGKRRFSLSFKKES